MDPAAASAPVPPVPTFEDGLGVRRQMLDPASQDRFELLCLRAELTAVPSFEFSVRERVNRLANFRHTTYARVRRVDRLSEPAWRLAVVSEASAGVRLSEVLQRAERRGLALDVNAALCLLRQLVPAVALLHQNARDVAHGAIGPERIIVTPHARLVVTDYVLGAALEQLHFSHERYWKEFRVAVPGAAGPPRFDHRTDVTQIGIVALSLILGRLLKEDEYPARIGDVVASASVRSALGQHEPAAPALQSWLARALQVDRRHSFTSALEAQTALEEVLSEESGYVAAPVALEAFLTRFHVDAERAPAALAPAPAPAPAPAFRGPQPGASHASPLADFRSSLPSAPAAPARGLSQPQPELRPVPMPSPEPVRIVPAYTAAPPARPAAAAPAGPFAAPLPAAAPPPSAYAPVLTGPSDPDAVREDEEADADPSKRRLLIVAAAALIVVVGGGAFAFSRYYRTPAAIGASMGTLVVESTPPGVPVVIDGEARGVTPVSVSLRAGDHVLELRGSGEPRIIPLTVPAGSQISQYVELPALVVKPGQLQVRTQPAGARVTIDGEPRGVSPITVADLAPGEHDVLLESAIGSVRQTIQIEAGGTASLVVPMAAPADAPLSGWVSIAAPVDVQLFEGGRLLGTSESDRIMVAAGEHQIELVNEALGYREARVVRVEPGRTVSLAIELPQGTLALNATPWAEVWVDGERVGETPIGNLPVTIGQHEVLFRHPELGERRHAITVTTNLPGRLSVDLRVP